VAIVVVVFAGMAAGQPTAAPCGATRCASRHGAERLGGTGPALLPENLERLRRPAAGDTIAEGRTATQMPTLDADSRAVPLPLTADPPVTAELPRTRVARCEAEAGSETR
jgi:mono/diheme cytochrome c family protein